MSVSKTEGSFNFKKYALIAGVGLLAAGTLIWALDDSDGGSASSNLDDQKAIEILKQINRECFPIHLEMARYCRSLIQRFRREGVIRGQRLSPQDIQAITSVLYSEKLPFSAMIKAVNNEVLPAFGVTLKELNEYTKARQESGNMPKELAEYLKVITQVRVLIYQGVEPLIQVEVPAYLTKEWLMGVSKESKLVFIRKVGELVKSFIARGESVIRNQEFLKDFRAIRQVDVIMDKLKEFPQVFELEHHPLNYYYFSLRDFAVKDKEGFGKENNAYASKTNDILLKFIGTQVTAEQIDELVGELENFDPKSYIDEMKNKEKEFFEKIMAMRNEAEDKKKAEAGAKVEVAQEAAVIKEEEDEGETAGAGEGGETGDDKVIQEVKKEENAENEGGEAQAEEDKAEGEQDQQEAVDQGDEAKEDQADANEANEQQDGAEQAQEAQTGEAQAEEKPADQQDEAAQGEQ